MSVKISVCIPVYNPCFEFLEATIRSVYAQEGGDFDIEIIVSDDASTSNVAAVLNQFPKNTINYQRNSTNQGMVANWNRAVSRSTGELVILLSQDDVLLPNMFGAYVNQFSKHPSAVMCSCGRKFINQQGDEIRPWRAVNDRKNIFLSKNFYRLSGEQAINLCLRNGNVIGEPSAVMYRKWAFDRLNGYDRIFRHAADLDFNLRMSQLGPIIYVRHPYLSRRIHDSNLTRLNFSSGGLSLDRLRIYERFINCYDLPAERVSMIDAYMFSTSIYDLLRALHYKNWGLAKQSAVSAQRFFRVSPLTYLRQLLELCKNTNLDAI